MNNFFQFSWKLMWRSFNKSSSHWEDHTICQCWKFCSFCCFCFMLVVFEYASCSTTTASTTTASYDHCVVCVKLKRKKQCISVSKHYAISVLPIFFSPDANLVSTTKKSSYSLSNDWSLYSHMQIAYILQNTYIVLHTYVKCESGIYTQI